MITLVQACNAAFGAQGLALFRSLERHLPTGSWRMVWATIDDELADALERLALGWLTIWRRGYMEVVVPGLKAALAEIERRDGAKSGPWWWTWASQATHAAIELEPGETVVYLDSDCWAMGDVTPAIAEIAAVGADVGLTTHRFPPHRKHMDARARYNVGELTTFAPTPRARACASWWAAMVRARCVVTDPGDAYLGIPEGRAGDQAATDAFARIAKVHEIGHPGIVAPYNWDACPMAERPPLILANMHEARFEPRTGLVTKRTGYPIPDDVLAAVVLPYERAVAEAAAELWA